MEAAHEDQAAPKAVVAVAGSAVPLALEITVNNLALDLHETMAPPEVEATEVI